MSAQIMGNEIVWLTPFNFPQKLTFEVDYSVMLSFIELYSNLLKFINYKLYKDVGLDYPPSVENVYKPFFGYGSKEIYKIQQQIQERMNFDKEKLTNQINCESKEMNKIIEVEEEDNKRKSLFKNLVFYISREVPNELVALVITSCGGLYGDENENSAFKYNDKAITHYIVDRKPEFIEFVKNKEFIQPQWVFDCVNSCKLLPISEYEPGKSLPPHISPFFEYDNNEYKDKITKNIKEEKEEEPEKIKQKEFEEKSELREMLISNKKKKLLQKLRNEKAKKPKKLKTKIKNSNN